MVKVLGNATTGNIYNDLGPLDLPRDTNSIRPAHKPWCVDCKRKDRELDNDQRCPQCANAAVTRAAAAERRAEAERAAAQLAVEQAAEIRAKKIQTNVTTPTKLPTEGNQGQPTTRSSAPRATSTSSISGRAPDAGSSTTREKNPPAAQDTRPAAAGGPSQPVESRQPSALQPSEPTVDQILDAQAEHATNLLRRTHQNPHPAVKAQRSAVIAAIEALHLLVELTSVEQAPTPAAPRRRRQGRSGPQRLVLPADDIVAAYKAGRTLGQIADDHDCSAPTIGRILEEQGVPRRGAPVPRSPELIEQVRHLYQDEHLTQVEIGERIGQTTKVVQSVMTEAGIDRRSAKARHGRDNARGLKQKIADLGVTSAQIKAWAINAGHLDQMHRGLPSGALVEKYSAAHRRDDVA